MRMRVNQLAKADNISKFVKIVSKHEYKIVRDYGIDMDYLYKISLVNLKHFYKKRYVNKKLKMLLKNDLRELQKEKRANSHARY